MSFNPASLCLSLATALVFFSVGHSNSAHAQNSNEPLRFNKIQEVIENWNVDQHLYVKGDVGVSGLQLAKLEQWLDKNGKNWTIVLMDSSEGQTFETASENRYRGREAVYYALGHGLSNQTDFGNQLHPVSHEPYGAIFVLFRKDRKFNYFASDAQDRQRLGEANWLGGWDREAIRAMRNGARVTDAVKNTITSIDRHLTARINIELKNERRKKEREVLAKQRSIAKRKQEINHLKTLAADAQESLLQRVVTGAAKLKKEFPDAETSALANPPIATWQNELKAVTNYLNDPKLLEDESLLNSSDLKLQRDKLNSIQGQLHRFLDQLAAHASFEEQVQPIELRLDGALFHPSRVGIPAAELGYEQLKLARRAHDLGQVDFTQQLAEAEKLAEQGEAVVAEHVEAERLADQHSRIIRRTLLWASGGITALIAIVLAALNFFRRKFLNQAYAAFQHCQIETEKLDRSLTLLTKRSEEIIGDRKTFTSQEYAGLTLEKGLSSLRQLDQLIMMSNEANRVLGLAQQHLYPPSVFGQAANMVSSRRYQQCVNLLTSKSFELPASHSEQPEKNKSWVSFDDFSAESARRSADVANLLDQFETSFAQQGPLLSKLNSAIDSIVDKEQTLASRTRRDQFFNTPALFDSLIPSLQEDLSRISKVAKSDPLSVTTLLIPAAQQKISNTQRLIESIEHGRESTLPMLDDADKQLRRLGHDTRWIDNQTRDLSAPANQLFEQVISQNVAEQVDAFSRQVRELGSRAKRTAELAKTLSETTEPSIDQLAAKIDRERKTIANSLNLPIQSALSEVDYNPTACLQMIQSQFQSARAAVAYGGVESIMESLEVIAVEKKHAEGFVQSSLDALNNYEVDLSNRNEVLKRLKDLIPSHVAQLNEREPMFSDAAFRISPDIESNYELLVDETNESPTLQVLLDACRNSIKHCEQILTSVQSDQEQGRVLRAANHLMLTQNELSDVDQTLAAVREHYDLMDQQDLSNKERVPRTAEHIEDLKSRAADERTQRPTKNSVDNLAASFSNFRKRFDDISVRRDPFSDKADLEGFDQSRNHLSQAIQSDIKAHGEASRALAGAESELTRAMVLLQQTADDQIPDSNEIDLCRTAVRQADKNIEQIRNQLVVPHGDWRKVDADATDANTRLAVTIGELRRQLQLAQRAAKSLRAAASSVFEAANWRGHYGISVVGNPGSDDLEYARANLGQGNYDQCIQFAKSAQRLADNAVQVANDQVQAERRRIARQAEARRRKRRQRSSISFGSSSSSSSFGGSTRSHNSSRSSSSSSFGSSRSSSSSSGSSGFGQESGW